MLFTNFIENSLHGKIEKPLVSISEAYSPVQHRERWWWSRLFSWSYFSPFPVRLHGRRVPSLTFHCTLLISHRAVNICCCHRVISSLQILPCSPSSICFPHSCRWRCLRSTSSSIKHFSCYVELNVTGACHRIYRGHIQMTYTDLHVLIFI